MKKFHAIKFGLLIFVIALVFSISNLDFEYQKSNAQVATTPYFRMNCGTNGSAWPRCGWQTDLQSARPDYYPRYWTWSRRTDSPPPGSTDYTRMEHHYPSGWTSSDSTQYYHGWTGATGAPNVGYNQSIFYRLRMRHPSGVSWSGYEFDPDSPSFLQSSPWGTKFMILGNGGALHPNTSFSQEGDSFSRVIASMGLGEFNVSRNIESPIGTKGTQALFSLDQWHDFQFEIHTSSSHDSTDGYIKLWVDNNNYVSPTDQTQLMLLTAEAWTGSAWVSAGLGGGNLSFGTTAGIAAQSGNPTYDIAAFEVDDQFDSAWDQAGGISPTPSPTPTPAPTPTPSPSPTPPPTGTLPTPTNLTATTSSDTQINLDWTDNATNETGYKFERKIGTTGTYSEIGNTEASHFHRDRNSGLAAGTTYYYRVRAYNGSGFSSYSNEVSATTTGVNPNPTPPPSSLPRSISLASLQGPTNKTVSGTLKAYNSSRTEISSIPFTTNSSGSANVTFTVPAQTVTLKTIIPKYLNKTLANVNLSSTSTYTFATVRVGDLNADNIVNSVDFSSLNQSWFQNNAARDLNNDGIVNSVDYSLMNPNWFINGDIE